MDFGFDSPVPFAHVLGQMNINSSRPSAFVSGRTDHVGTCDLNGQEMYVGATETPEGVTEFSVDFPRKFGCTFLGIPLGGPTADFTKTLDEKGIPWADPGNSGIVLYEHWMAFFDDAGEVNQILWYNRELVTDLELLDIAFPPLN